MTSVALIDTWAVEYFYTATSSTCGSNLGGGRTNSGWISSRNYSDSGLSPNQCYAYTVKGRDASGNMTSTSTASTTYTLAATPGGPTYSSVGVTSLNLTNTENGNPGSNPTTLFAVRASSTDSAWNNKWVGSGGSANAAPQWLSDATVLNLAISGLIPNTRYDFESVARNQNSVLTATSTRTGTTTLADTSAPSPAPTFSSGPDNNGTTRIDMTSSVPGTEATPPIQYQFAYNSTGCAANNGGDGSTRTWSTSNTYSNTGLSVNKCYSYTVQARDSVSPTPNATAISSEVDVYTGANTPSAPTLSGATDTTFVFTNNENGNPSNTEFAVHISATSPTDGNWNGKYLKADGTPSATAVWLTDAQLTSLSVVGLAFSTQYTLEVKARNGDNDETAYGSSANITTTADSNAPTPNPATFSSAPNNDSTSQISMTATAATDASTPISYYFDAVTGSCGANLGTGGTDSAWQQSTSYSDSGLQTNKCYAYTVTSRDSIPNTGSASASALTYTSAAVPGQVSFVSRTLSTVTINNTENGNPASNPSTQFAILVTTTDGTWNNKYVDASGNPSASAVWRTDAQFDGIPVLGLQANTDYTFAVKARNGENEETAFGSNQTFTSAHPPETRLQGVRLNGVRVN